MPASAVMRPPPAAGPRLRNWKPRCGPVVSSSLRFSGKSGSANLVADAAGDFVSAPASHEALEISRIEARTACPVFISLLFSEGADYFAALTESTRGHLYRPASR